MKSIIKAFGLTGLFLSVCLLALLAQSQAQLSEFEFARFVPGKTFAALSINMESVMQRMDKDDPLVRKFLNETKESSGMDFSQTTRVLILICGDVPDARSPVAVLIQHKKLRP